MFYWLPTCLETRVLGSCALLVRVACVLVGSGYLHTLNLVSLVRLSLVGVSLVRAGWCALLVRAGWK